MVIKKPTAPQLYPDLPQDQLPDQGVPFRLHKISEIRNKLEEEINARDKLRRKYKTAWNACYTVAQVSGVCAVSAGGGAVGTVATGIGAVAAIPLSGLAIAGGVVSAASVALGKALMKKVEKHESIRRTAESSLNTVDKLVSRALEDQVVSNEDFHHIMSEWDNYRGHKAGIKHRTRADLIELTAEREKQIRAEGEEAGRQLGKKETMNSLLRTAQDQAQGGN